jgi:hypothetical protein
VLQILQFSELLKRQLVSAYLVLHVLFLDPF